MVACACMLHERGEGGGTTTRTRHEVSSWKIKPMKNGASGGRTSTGRRSNVDPAQQDEKYHTYHNKKMADCIVPDNKRIIQYCENDLEKELKYWDMAPLYCLASSK